MSNKTNDLAPFLFHQGTNYQSYEYLGVHRVGNEYSFRVWAPHAESVFVVGDFNGWGEDSPMHRITDGGLFEIYIPCERFSESALYKYKIRSGNKELYKADPYGVRMERIPGTASEIYDITGYAWRDESWMRRRRTKMKDKAGEQPINIYEVHLGSWKRHEDGSYYSYEELARELSSYVKQMGYTHVELMPVMEHPFDGSWGYQVCGYYAPSSRFGTPKDFMAFVDCMHEAGIGVILDWVPAHFPKDAHGLYEFDGCPLYEYQGADRMEHRGWGTRCFDVGRNEVQSFLVSNALYWAKCYHADGLRVDAVASMLYLDYDKMPGEWVPNVYGDNRNLEAIAFFQKLNGEMKRVCPDVLMIAEESTAFGNVTRFEDGGLGFSSKWNMGWMNDALAYAALDPIYKKYHHNQINFSLMYSFSERFILPISHDEVVHGKKSLLDKMPGDYRQKFDNTRAFLTYMMTHPGKKLLFMGGEIGQFREWDYDGSIEWFLLDYESHARLQLFAAELNHFYLEHPELYQVDDSWEGFQWIDADDRDRSIISYRRIDKKGNELIVVINFTPVCYRDFSLRVPELGEYEELLNSDEERFGGQGNVNQSPLAAESRDGSTAIKITVPPLAATILKRKKNARKKK